MLQSRHFAIRTFGARASSASRINWLVALLASAAACGGNVVVGEAKDDAGAPTTLPVLDPTSDAGTGGMSDCTAADEKSRAGYDAWTVQPNSFGSLTGKTFTGYVEGGPDLALTIDATGAARLAVGAPAPAPTANMGYLCGEGIQNGSNCEIRYDTPPIPGGVYPLHGASFAADRLLVPLQPSAPYDPWCILQTPHETDVCFFQPIGLDGFSITPSTGTCKLGGQPVDCGWMELAGLGVCGCTSQACFASIYAETSMRIDARFDETTHELAGSFIDGDRSSRALYLIESIP